MEKIIHELAHWTATLKKLQADTKMEKEYRTMQTNYARGQVDALCFCLREKMKDTKGKEKGE